MAQSAIASSRPAASLDGHFEHPVWLCDVVSHIEVRDDLTSSSEFFRNLLIAGTRVRFMEIRRASSTRPFWICAYSRAACRLRFHTIPVCSLELNPSFS